MKDRAFEVTLFVVGLVGLFILFTLMYIGPRFLINKILESFGG